MASGSGLVGSLHQRQGTWKVALSSGSIKCRGAAAASSAEEQQPPKERAVEQLPPANAAVCSRRIGRPGPRAAQAGQVATAGGGKA
jgi:hypothetical protein